jgi:hypothetical protein
MKWKMPRQFYGYAVNFFQFIPRMTTVPSSRQMKASWLWGAAFVACQRLAAGAHCRQPSRIAG